LAYYPGFNSGEVLQGWIHEVSKRFGDGSPPVGSRGKNPVENLGDKFPKAEAKCEISEQF